MIQEIDYKCLGSRIKQLRQSRGFTQESLAEAVGCNTTHISNIENYHTKASLNVLLAIANALGTTVDYLLSDQYTASESALDNAVLKAIAPLDDDRKEKILKIIEILYF